MTDLTLDAVLDELARRVADELSRRGAVAPAAGAAADPRRSPVFDLREASSYLHVGLNQTRDLFLTGEVVAWRNGTQWLTDRESLDAFIARCKTDAAGSVRRGMGDAPFATGRRRLSVIDRKHA